MNRKIVILEEIQPLPAAIVEKMKRHTNPANFISYQFNPLRDHAIQKAMKHAPHPDPDPIDGGYVVPEQYVTAMANMMDDSLPLKARCRLWARQLVTRWLRPMIRELREVIHGS